MKKSNSWLKLILIVIAAIALFFVIAAVLLVTFVDPNKYKTQISTLVKQNTGREFVIAGDVKWSFFPWVGIRLNELAMGNAPGFNQHAFAQVAEADITLRVLPLFHGKVEIGKIILKNPVIHLAKNAQGQTNWSDLISSNKNSKTPSKNTSLSTAPKNLSLLASLAIANIDVSNATVTWDNAQTKQTLAVDQLNLKTANISWGKPFPISLDFHLKSNKPLIDTTVSLNSDVVVDPFKQIYNLNNLQIKGKLINPKFKQAIPFSLQTDIASNLKTQTLDAKNIEFKFDNLLAKGTLSGTTILQSPIFNGQININSFNLRNVLNDLGNAVAFQNSSALTQVSLNTPIAFSPKYLKLNPLHLTLDQSTITGQLSVADFATKRFDFDIKINTLNLDDYSSKTNPTTASSTPKTGTTTPSASGSPFSALLGLNGSGSLQIDKLTTSKLQLANFYTQLIANNGVIKFSPLSANLYQGKTQGSILINAPASSIDVTNTLTNIQIGPLWQDLTSTSKIKIIGLGNVNMQLHTQGNTPDAFKRHLNGNIRFSLTQGAIENLNLSQQIFTAVNYLLKDNNTSSNDNQTHFSSLTGTVLLNNGIASNNDLVLKSTAMQVLGKGSADIVNQTINYSLKIIAQGDPFGRDVFDVQNKIGGSFPVLITGSFSSPHVTPDLQTLARAFLKGQVKQQINQQINNVIQKNLNNDLGKTLQQGIQNLLK